MATEKQARAAYIAFIAAPEPEQTSSTITTTSYPTWIDLDSDNKELWYSVANAVLDSEGIK